MVLKEYLRTGMDLERKAARELQLPPWALALPLDRQRQILQAQRMATQSAREKEAECARIASDIILYGRKS